MCQRQTKGINDGERGSIKGREGRHLPPDWPSQAQRWSMMEGGGSGAKRGGSSLSGDAWLSVSQVLATAVCGCIKVQSQVTNWGLGRRRPRLFARRDGG